MNHYCTYFDARYLPQGLALYQSLRRHAGPFTLWVLCLDEPVHRFLQESGFPEVRPLRLEDLERDDSELGRAKQNRSLVEYYFTLTPALPRWILEQHPDVKALTYLDADLYFFSSPRPIYEELGRGSILIVPHRFDPGNKRTKDLAERYGTFNVGLLVFRRTPDGLQGLDWWRERCLEWCYDRVEPGRFADQKYLDEWPRRFRGVVVSQNAGVGLAPWNLSRFQLTREGKSIRVDGVPLVFYHFQGLRRVLPHVYDPNLAPYGAEPAGRARRWIYRPYVEELERARQSTPPDASGSSNEGFARGARRGAPLRLAQRLLGWARTGQRLFLGRLVVAAGGFKP